MNIGAASARSGLPEKTIRYYEEIGLIAPSRRGNGYRDYGERDLHILKFLHRSRSLGFSIEDCRSLLSLYRDRERASADVKQLAERRLAEIDGKIRELQSIKRTLAHLAQNCHGDARPDCPILDDLAGEAAAETAKERI